MFIPPLIMNLHASNVTAQLPEEKGALSQPRKPASLQHTVYFTLGVSRGKERESEDCTNSGATLDHNSSFIVLHSWIFLYLCKHKMIDRP